MSTRLPIRQAELTRTLLTGGGALEGRALDGSHTHARSASRTQMTELHSLADRLRLAGAAANDCLWDWDLVTDRITRSSAMATRFGYPPDAIDATSSWWRERIHPEDRARAGASIDAAIADPNMGTWSCEYRFTRFDGSYAEVGERASIVRDVEGRALRVIGAVMDLSEIHQAYRALQQSEERYRCTIDLTGQIAWSADAQGEHVEFDERWTDLTGVGRIVGQQEWELAAHPEDVSKALNLWTVSVSSGEPLDLEHRLRTVNGEYRWFRSRAAPFRNGAGQIERWYGTIEDIHERKASRQALKTLATVDELTGLANRRLFSEELEKRLKRAQSRQTSAALLVLDIDDFKSVNDLFGHDAGDLLLRSFAARMRADSINLYRIGGDEFAAILGSADRKSANQFADGIHAALQEPFRLEGQILFCRASIGCAMFPTHGGSSSELLKSADIALYAAKGAGRGQTRVFASAMRNDLQRRRSMTEVARQSLSADRVTPYFQPKVNLRTGRVAGFEALMRVQNDRFGAQQPAIIAAAFDHPELAIELADRMLLKIIAVVRRWREQGLCFGRIAVNASPLEFRGGKYAERLLSQLHEHGIDPKQLEVEITETVFLNRAEDSIAESLQVLKDAGVTVALDDFGTGYASLSHLRRFPVDVLKIDQTFIREMIEDPRQQLITRAIIDLSRTIGIQTVAEGIETQEQAELLKTFGCDLGQGFLFGRALSEEQAEAVLNASDAQVRNFG